MLAHADPSWGWQPALHEDGGHAGEDFAGASMRGPRIGRESKSARVRCVASRGRRFLPSRRRSARRCTR
eukprot:1194311-Pleurochrysis_carterae.AAC.1